MHYQNNDEKLITEAYRQARTESTVTSKSLPLKEFSQFYAKYKSLFLEGCTLTPTKIAGNVQEFTYNSGPIPVHGDIIFCNVSGHKKVMVNEAVAHSKVPLIKDNKLQFNSLVITYKMPNEDIQTIRFC